MKGNERNDQVTVSFVYFTSSHLNNTIKNKISKVNRMINSLHKIDTDFERKIVLLSVRGNRALVGNNHSCSK